MQGSNCDRSSGFVLNRRSPLRQRRYSYRMNAASSTGQIHSSEVNISSTIKHFIAFYRTGSFSTVFARSSHYFLSLTTRYHTKLRCLTFPKILFNIILPFTPMHSKLSLPFGISVSNFPCTFRRFYTCCIPFPS